MQMEGWSLLHCLSFHEPANETIAEWHAEGPPPVSGRGTPRCLILRGSHLNAKVQEKAMPFSGLGKRFTLISRICKGLMSGSAQT